MRRIHSVGEQSDRKPELKRYTTAKQGVDPFEMQWFYLTKMISNIKMATIDGKQIVNMLYLAGVETLLTVGYSKLGKNTKKSSTKGEEILGCFLMIYCWQWPHMIC